MTFVQNYNVPMRNRTEQLRKLGNVLFLPRPFLPSRSLHTPRALSQQRCSKTTSERTTLVFMYVHVHGSPKLNSLERFAVCKPRVGYKVF